jgi:hypothetical protein
MFSFLDSMARSTSDTRNSVQTVLPDKQTRRVRALFAFAGIFKARVNYNGDIL